MYLYSLTLQQATGIICAINGNFSGGKTQEIAVARGKILDLLRPDENGKIQTIHSVEVFGAIRSLAQFRLTGAHKDYIVVGSDSGRIVILEYNKEKNVFDKVHQETFGKSGCRRIVPGQYLAVDPKGRAVMIGACEKQKLVYVLNRDTTARLTISSPLEAHKSHTICYSVCGVDCGFDNPIFAAIELDYSEADQDPTGQAASEAQKHLTFYELDLGLNHVSRKWSEPVDNGANMLVTVPGGADGPSGVLVCAENFVIYKNQGHPDVRSVIPRRADLPAERGVLVVSAAVHKQKTMFFFLIQTEYGDIFKVTLDHNGDNVSELKIKRACLIALSGGELIYFEADMSGQLMEVDKHEMSGDVACLDIAPVPEGRQRSRFLAVGSYDNTVRILSLDPDDCLQILSVQSVSSAPESLLFLEVQASIGGEDGADHPANLFLNSGLQNGVLFRTVVDMVTGQLSDSRSRFLGLKPPKLFSISVRGRSAMLCLSSRPWLGYIHRGHFHLTPLSYDTLEFAAPFSSDQCAEGVVSVAGDALRIFMIDRLGETFNETVVPLRYTPRKFVVQPKRKLLVIIESDQGAFTAEEREAARKECFEAGGMGENGNADQMENGADDEDKEDPLSDEQYGYPKAVSEKWVSCIRVLDPKTATTTCLLELQDNEAAYSVCTVNFHDKEYGTLLAVGTVKGMQFWPKKNLVAGFIHIYRFVEDGKSLELLHKTQVEGVPLALCQFQGRLLAGIGPVLRLYDLGKKRLLRKCENKLFPNTIISIQTYRDRIYVGDIQESFHYCKYRRDENQLYIFADDCVPRWLTASHHVDFDTMAGADKFGNVYFVRLPQDVSEEIEEDPTGGKIKWEQGKLNGAPNKVDEIVQFHVGDVVTCMQKASMIPGGSESLMYGTVMGSIGALHAFTSRDDVDFFSHLEMHMRQEYPPLCGRDHMAYRSAYFPVKDVIDGDLCEQFPTLPMDLQRKIADELDRTPAEILKKLEDARNKII
ncbi:spliceosome-associated protein 130 A [Capsella rubella]|nr:spliceosome-associated protein 130 A [Capsella rubella]